MQEYVWIPESLRKLHVDKISAPLSTLPDVHHPLRRWSYLEYLEKKVACGVDGCLTKLQRISKALSYVTQELHPNDEQLFFHCQQVAERYAKWRRVLQKERTLKSKLQLEKVSNEPRPLSQMVALTHHKPLWDNVAQLLLWAATTTLPPNEQRNVVACSPGRVDRAEKLAATRSGHLCNSPRISSIREGGWWWTDGDGHAGVPP